MDIDPEAKDSNGIPKLRIHFKWGENELKMWEHAKKTSADLLRAACGIVEDSIEGPETPGYSQHEIGTCRMGNDAKEFVTNRFGQSHDVNNLFICDSSVLVNCTDKAPTLSILAFSLRSSEFMVEQFREGVFGT